MRMTDVPQAYRLGPVQDRYVTRLEDRTRQDGRMDVHCCCNPGQLLGSVPGAPVDDAHAVVYEIPGGPVVTLPVRRLEGLHKETDGITTTALLWFKTALESHEYSLAVLRRIPGWRDAPALEHDHD